METQETELGGRPTQVEHEDDNYDSSDGEAPTKKDNTAKLVGDVEDDEDEDDEDYEVEQKKKSKSRRKRVVSDEEDDDEAEEPSESNEGKEKAPVVTAKGDEGTQGADDESDSSLDSETSSSESEDDAEEPANKKKRREPSARQESKKRAKKAEEARKQKQEKKKPEQPVSTFNALMSGLKAAKKKELSVDEKARLVDDTINIMTLAYEKDLLKRRNGEPALEKLLKLDEVMTKLTDQQLLHTFVDRKVGYALVDWLKPSKKALPNIKLRTKLFKAIEKMPFPEHEESIKSSQIGKILNFYRCHPEETLENKRLTNAIISRWMDILTKN